MSGYAPLNMGIDKDIVDLVTIDDESIAAFKDTVAKEDGWMLYYFKIKVRMSSGVAVETEAQVFMDIPEMLDSVDNLLLRRGSSILFDSGGKYTVEFEYDDTEHLRLIVTNGKEEYVIVERFEFLKNIYSLLKKVQSICMSVARPSAELINQMHVIDDYLRLLESMRVCEK